MDCEIFYKERAMKSAFRGFKFRDLFFYFFEALLEYDVAFVADVISSHGSV